MSYRFKLLLLVGVAALVISGCANDDAETTEGRSDTLTIYSYDAFPESLETAIVSHFEETFDVTPELRRFQDTGELYNQTYLERENPEADVVIGLDNTYVGRALEAELFQEYRPEGAEWLRSDLVLDESFRLVPFDWGHIVLNYDSEMLPDPPESWEELLDPRLEESIVLMNPRTSSPGRNFLLLTIHQFGEEGYLEFWEQLKPNILTITAGWSDGYGLYTQGEAPIVLSYETSPAYHIAFEDTDRYRNLILDHVGYAQIEVAGITADAPSPENAQRLMDYLLSTVFQEQIPLNQFMYPIRPDVELPEAFQQVETASETAMIPVSEVDENYERWLEDWETVMR